ncbi:MAG: DEAD/DEAH box helicase [Novosphingobium sp.]|nr:DEAD/DEAH box helicase [Novosphingobium sp.]MCZ8019029.1 DEAD/DEAH box helicase [Novosphingobium sp.]MCZ8034635.1 DEAD/DEAH box helicase [Novosphingobium sp.]MCZ8052183.1 DEAD/DEAH box helicase [Novosphingobium sp.]MCZ8060109.1 DEAD/DEAH box helicase [Novosphingobium sp.]MCZ8231071.1 DEAD/DEAH box helicase [Novosphingobium sp.]
MTYFTDLGLAEPLVRALETKGYADPTPIQRQAIPALLEGRDLLGIAQTGTGKTAAFSLPSLHRLAANPKARSNASCRMLVLSPTRELADQIAENMRGYAKYLNLSVQCVFGGIPVGKQARALVPGCDILVATPGRLLDLIDQRALTLRNVEIFVLDEADQMMDLGFIVPLKRVANMLPKERQSLFFSATMPKAIAELGKQFIHNPVRVEVTPQATTAERVDQFVTFLNQAEKQALLTLKLRAGLADGSIDRALVFTRTKHGADRVVRHLSTAGVNAAAIHGNKSQAQRTAALLAFRKGSTPVLVATDIAARGIDVSGVSHVFNFELPNVAEQYVHRIGRTARAGADGVALSFCAPDEKAYLKDIERLTGVKLMPQSLPEDFQKEAARLPLPSRKPAEAEQDARREERDARGLSGAGRGGQNRGRNNNRSPGGQSRDGQSRDQHHRNERVRSEWAPREQRGPVFNPLAAKDREAREFGVMPKKPHGDRRPGGHAPGQAERRPAPQGDRRGAPQGERRPAPQGDRRPSAHGDRRPAPQGERRDGARLDQRPDQRPDHRGDRRGPSRSGGQGRNGPGGQRRAV